MTNKKILREEISSVVDENGQFKEESKSILVQFPKEPPFIKLYLDDINKLYELPNDSTALLYELLKRMDYDGLITLNSTLKKIISGLVGVGVGHIDNYLSKLVKKDIFKRMGRGVYAPNPSLFGRGDWRDIQKKRNAWLRVSYDENGKKVSSSFDTDDSHKQQNLPL